MPLDLILPFDEVKMSDLARVGGKNASLGEMRQNLSARGVAVPDGFATTADAYRRFLRANELDEQLKALFSQLDIEDLEDLRARGQAARHLILDAPLPEELTEAVREAYDNLCASAGIKNLDVAVRSSATAEDLPDASFAGQQETYLNIHGHASLLAAVRSCYASLFTDRAISYRVERGFDHNQVALSVGVQRMVRSDLASAGVMFSIDTETGFEDAVLITGAWGLGETVVQGTVNPDEFIVFKPTLKQGKRPILRKHRGSKEVRMVYASGSKHTKTEPVPAPMRDDYTLDDDEVVQLAKWACVIEDHYSEVRGQKTPMDIEWAKDGQTGELFIVQARPETVQSRKALDVIETWTLKEKGDVLVDGRAVGEKIAQGKVQVIHKATEITRFEEGNILVTDMTDPDWEPVLRKASAIVTNRGGRTCHAAIVARELGLPAVVGVSDATDVLKDGQEVTVSCAEGEVGRVYEGKLEFEVDRAEIDASKRPNTKVMINLADPDAAFRVSALPNDGVGLLREEFMIARVIGIHPMALLHPEKIDDPAVLKDIEERTKGYDDKAEFFVDQLSQGIAMIAAAFHPKDVIVRMSDFKSNEYADLVGGHFFEPVEENPMIGFRGASRYYDERYREGFALECQALRRVREDMGLTNVKVMIPFCRTVDEGKKVLEVMAENGLERGKDDLEVYVMCEIPSNVVLAEQFAEIFDGFSIGSNDLTQLTLGCDRDSSLIAHIFDERNDAVTFMLKHVIRTAKECGRKVGICGQGPSDYPEMAKFLMEEGIDSMSLTPDAVLRTTQMLLEVE
jgi:pyruvate,water dikinase